MITADHLVKTFIRNEKKNRKSEIALAPAVCEEMLFRGLILHALKARYRAVSAIVITAVLAGAREASIRLC